MALKLVTAPIEKPVSLAEAKAYLRVDGTSEDALIDSLIGAATSMVEKATGRLLITQTWDLWLDHFPRARKRKDDWFDGVMELPVSSLMTSVRYIEIPKPPLQDVSFLKTFDEVDDEETFEDDNYFVDDQSTPGRVALNEAASWPSIILRPANGIQIQFVAGYGAAVDVPDPIKIAIQMIVAHLYENRGCETTVIPAVAFALIQPYAIVRL